MEGFIEKYGISFNTLMVLLKTGAWEYLVPFKILAEQKGFNISYKGIAEFLANKHVRKHILKLSEDEK